MRRNRSARILGSAVLCLAMVGCVSSVPAPAVGTTAAIATAPITTTTSNGSSSTGTDSTDATGAAGGSPAGSAVPAGMFANPVVRADMPDPALLRVGATFYLYSTQSDTKNVQTATSTDLITWTAGSDALPTIGRWADPGKTWAPEVLAIGGRYVMFYTASDTASGKQCIGRAESADPAGPFVDDASAPLVCQRTMGGSIDPNPVVIGGKVLLYWKNDGNCCSMPVHLWGQAMDATARQLTGRPTALLQNTQVWQGNLVEAPEMIAHDGRYYLFYAANDYASISYAEGYAVCTTPLGTCTDSRSPFLASTNAAAGPGHGFIFQVGGQTWILYHAWPPDAVGSQVPGRQLWLDRVTWSPAGPSTTGPTAKPQPAPKI